MKVTAPISVALAAVVWPWLSDQAIADPKGDAANRKTMHEYARCVVKAHHKRAADMIVADENNSAIMARYRDLISPDCMSSVAGYVAMTFGGDLYRYALADALVDADFSDQGPKDFSDRLPLAHFAMPDQAQFDAESAKAGSQRKRDALRRSYDKNVGVAWLSRYGECVVRQDPVAARLWLLTPPETPEETSRINALRPAFSACLEGGTLKFNRITMRGTVAINYCRLAMATPIAASRKAS